MGSSDVHFSSARHDWETPDDLFDALNSTFGFELDVCADVFNNKISTYYSAEDDGLKQEWGPRVCWMNPPYGRQIGEWMKKAVKETMERNAQVVALVPSRTDTAWWHDYVMPFAGEVWFIRGRLRFKGADHAAPFPSAIIVYDQTLLVDSEPVPMYEFQYGLRKFTEGVK